MPTSLILIALALAGCSSSNSNAVPAPGPAAAPPPVEGVYPDCRFGVLPPDDARSPACAPPAGN